jgi:hypothetical protein
MLACGFAGQVLVRLLMAAGRKVPLMIPDETGYLLTARLLSGGATGDMSGRTFYQAGYPLLITPVYWFTGDPAVVYQCVLAVNALLGAVLFLLAYAGLRRFEVGRLHAYAFAHAAALLPGLMQWGQFALTDVLLAVVVSAWLLTLHSWSSHDSAVAGAVSGALAAYTSVIHSRGAVVLAVHLMAMAFVLLKRRSPLRATAVIAGTPVLVAAAGGLLNRWTSAKIYPAGALDLGAILVKNVTSLSGLAWTVSLAAGKLWCVAVSGWGLSGVGFVAVVFVVVRGGDLRVPAGAALAVVLGIALASSAALPDEGTVANYAYGRYLTCMMPSLFVVGAVLLMRSRLRTVARAGLGTALLAITALSVVFLYAGEGINKRFYGAFDFPDISFLAGDWATAHLWQATWAGLAVFGAGVAARAAFGRRAGLPVFAVALVALSLTSVTLMTIRVTAFWDDKLGTATSLAPAGLERADRVALAYPGMPWRIWVSHAFQVRGGLTPFDPLDRGEPARGITLIIVPWKAGTPAKASWPAARRGWHLEVARDTYAGGWTAWRRDSWVRPASLTRRA